MIRSPVQIAEKIKQKNSCLHLLFQWDHPSNLPVKNQAVQHLFKAVLAELIDPAGAGDKLRISHRKKVLQDEPWEQIAPV